MIEKQRDKTEGIPITQKKITIQTLIGMKERNEVISALSIYDASHAKIFDKAGGHVIVVGDSAAMVVQGKPSTKSMTMDEMVRFSQWVRNGTNRLFVISHIHLPSY